MTLENLLAIQKLQPFEPYPEGVLRLLVAAKRNLKDASIEELSGETRFDAAYKTIMQCAMLGLWANGYRTSTNQPGHHQVAIQSLPKTLGADQKIVILLDALRRQRNLADYEGDSITAAAVLACIDQATALLEHTEQWLKLNRPELLSS
jgi:hypothetical protein